MTEFSSSEYATWEAALDWAEKMHVLLTRGSVNAIDYLWGFFGEKYRTDALVSIAFENGRYTSHDVTPVGWITAQYARFVRPGFVRVGATASGGKLLVSAYKGPKTAVVVASNLDGSPVPIRVTLGGAGLARKVTWVRSSRDEKLRTAKAIVQRGGVFVATLPAQSLSTFVLGR